MKLLRYIVPVLLFPTVVLAAQQQNGTRAKSDFRAEFYTNLADVEQKMIALAEATPAEKYKWRPAGDIRSISEVYMHVVGGNYFLPTFIGAKAPARSGDPEKTVTTKAEVIDALRKSFHHLRAAVESLPESDLEKPVKMFGMQTTYRGVLLTMLTHVHEHLGQAIAYARMNGVRPPWSS